jgi:hypothetical protein
MRRAAVVALLVAATVAGCSTTNRPDGNAERFLEAASRSTDLDLLRELGTDEAAEVVTGVPVEEADRNAELLEDVEIAPGRVSGSTAVVPALVIRNGEETPRRFELTSKLENGTWRVVTAAPLTDDVEFPSEGGPTFGISTPAMLLATLATGLACLGLAVATIKLLGGARPDDPAQTA